ncbi:MAG TPA: 4-hydroxy-tetrahydrodipicolinate synthase [Steroidobacteraceae bacterium]|nr:4-hydroxy-tetrahydrodipicolinate synthase [Steroidobacteraceae bacterium]
MFSGSLVAIVTPMRADGALDLAAWSRLIDMHLQNGTAGIVVGGTTGESATLSENELKELTERACAQVERRIPVIAGAGTSSTATTVERIRWLSQLPVDALLVVTPAYNRPTQEGLYRHFAAAAQATRVPLIPYNVPARTAVDMLPETVARLSQLPPIVAVKEAVPRIERIRELKERCREGFDVLSGDDATAREAVLAGAVGVISVTANVAPRAMAELIGSAAQGERERAERIDASLGALHNALFLETSPIPVKWALARLGLIEHGVRLPLTELSERYHSALVSALRQAGALAA